MSATHRRPIIASVPLDSQFSGQTLLELPFPSSLEVVNSLLFAYLDSFSKPAHTIYVLDLSGSMQGDRLDRLKKAMESLTGGDRSPVGQFARFRNREQVSIITFSDQVQDDRTFTVTRDPSGATSGTTEIRDYVNSLQAGGATAIYSAMDQAYHDASRAIQRDSTYYTSVVLMTDGENNSGESSAQFLSNVQGLTGVQDVKAFTILFGEGSSAELDQIAKATGGKVFDARNAALSDIFQEIRGYQ
jgi:Ca-activated chloride channel family protein